MAHARQRPRRLDRDRPHRCAGALLGGFLAGALFGADPMDEFFDISSWLTAIVGSIILLVIYRLVVDRRGGKALTT